MKLRTVKVFQEIISKEKFKELKKEEKGIKLKKI